MPPTVRIPAPAAFHSDDGFFSPTEWLAHFFQLGAKRLGRFSTAETEERQAALFGYAYAFGKGIKALEVKPGEGPQRDYDALFRWKEATVRLIPVQLKRLPPTKVNATENLEKLIKKTALKCTGNDLLVAIQLDRQGQLTTTFVPKAFQIRELCLWGWSKPDHAELFVNSYKIGAARGHQWTVPFPPKGFRKV